MNKEYLVGIYIRLSKDDGTDTLSESIKNQKALLTKYVEDNNLTLAGTYIDDGYTGTNFNRPAFQRMIKDITDGKVNMVVTKDLSRLSRDYIGTGEYIEKWFPAHGVRYVALTDMVDTLEDSSNNDIAPFKAILNDMYAKDLSKKIRTALHTMQREGLWVGGCPPFGYKIDPDNKNHLIINEIEAPIVKRIFSLFLSGYNINKIKDKFNQENVPTFMKTRNKDKYSYWNYATIKKILSNQLYTGDMVQNRRNRVSYKYRRIISLPKEKWIIKENTHTPIITKEVFNQVQNLLPKQNTRKDKRNTYLLDGLLKCGECHHNIGIRNNKNNLTTICNYYRTKNKDNTLCTSHTFNYYNIESNIINIIKDNIAKLNKDAIINKCNINNNTNIIKKLEIELDNLYSSLDNMYLDKLNNNITNEMYQRLYNKINEDINNKKKIISNLKEQESRGSKESIIDNYLNNISRELILKLIKYIYIHEDGNIDIYFNFKMLHNECNQREYQ